MLVELSLIHTRMKNRTGEQTQGVYWCKPFNISSGMGGWSEFGSQLWKLFWGHSVWVHLLSPCRVAIFWKKDRAERNRRRVKNSLDLERLGCETHVTGWHSGMTDWMNSEGRNIGNNELGAHVFGWRELTLYSLPSSLLPKLCRTISWFRYNSSKTWKHDWKTRSFYPLTWELAEIKCTASHSPMTCDVRTGSMGNGQ